MYFIVLCVAMLRQHVLDQEREWRSITVQRLYTLVRHIHPIPCVFAFVSMLIILSVWVPLSLQFAFYGILAGAVYIRA